MASNFNWGTIRPDFAGSNLLADRSARMLGGSIGSIGDRMIAQSGVNKERNTGEVFANISALDSLDSLAANRSGILAGTKGKNVDRAAIVAALTQRRSDLQANDQFNYDQRMRDTLENRTAESHKSDMLSAGLGQNIQQQQITDTARKTAITELFRTNSADIIANVTATDKDGLSYIDNGKLQLEAQRLGVLPSELKTTMEGGFVLPAQRATEAAQAAKAVVDDKRANAREVAQTLTGVQSTEQVDKAFENLLPTLDAPWLSFTSDSSMQEQLKAQYEAAKLRMPAHLALKEIMKKVNGTVAEQEFTDRIFGGVDVQSDALTKAIKAFEDKEGITTQDVRFGRTPLK